MDKTLDKQVAIVTGASRGIGRSIALELARLGATVIGTATSESGAAAITAAFAEAGVTGRGAVLNVNDAAAAEALIDATVKEFGALNVLVNNAGITHDTTFVKMTKSMWDAVLRTNLDGLFNMTKPFVPGMIDAGFGRIVNIGSVNGERGAYGQANYAAAKAGIHGFTKSLALELARHGITVNTVAPGYLATAMLESVPKEVLDTKILPQIPAGRLGDPDEIAALVAFLCSDAGAFATGAEFDVNGGMYMR